MNDRHHDLDLVAYADGSADRATQLAVESHLTECADCSLEVEHLRSTLLLLEIANMPDE